MTKDLLNDLIQALTILPGVGKKSAQRMALYLLDKYKQGAKIMASENELDKLEDLDLAQNEIGDEGILALASSKKFPELVSIALDNNFASTEGKEEAKVGKNFKKLQSLNL